MQAEPKLTEKVQQMMKVLWSFVYVMESNWEGHLQIPHTTPFLDTSGG